jgi:MtN3 and saliva related transmembrane protein
MYEVVEMVGFFAASLGVASFMPQVVKIWRSKSVEAISSLMYVIYSVSVILWIIYGVMIKSPPLIIANLLILFLTISILAMKFLWK